MIKIVHETKNMYLAKVKDGFEICCNGVTHAVLVGKVKTEEKGRDLMEKLEKHSENLRTFLNHR